MNITMITYIFFLSMVPVAELRVALPYALSQGAPVLEAYILAVLGNILPIPFIILFFRPIIAFFENKPPFDKMCKYFLKKIQTKAQKMQKYVLWSLFLFVSVPLPGTGAWTGAGIAAVLGLRLKPSFIAISAGVCVAGLIMTLSYFGFIHMYKWFAWLGFV